MQCWNEERQSAASKAVATTTLTALAQPRSLTMEQKPLDRELSLNYSMRSMSIAPLPLLAERAQSKIGRRSISDPHGCPPMAAPTPLITNAL